MNIRNLLLAAILAAPTLAISFDAHAFAKCDDIEDAKKKSKCEKNETKRIGKLRKSTEAFMPSALHKDFAFMDKDGNPFDMDDYYVGKRADIGIESVDAITNSVTRIEAALTMATYVSALAKEGKNDDAKKVATALLPELKKMPDDVKAIMENVEKLKADPASLVSNPMDVPKVLKNLGGAASSLPALAERIPKAVAAVGPLASGAAGAAVNEAMKKVPSK